MNFWLTNRGRYLGLESPTPRAPKIPWYAGADHCVEWPTRSPGSGFLSADSGLGTQSLRDPGSVGYLDPATAPKNEEEWKALFAMCFDDLVPEALADPSPNVTWKQRQVGRTELEKSIFSNTNVHSGLRTRPSFTRDTRFHVRWVGPLFAVATAVTCTTENEAIYDAIAKDSRSRQMHTFSSQLKLRIAEASTVTKAEELLAAISKATETYEKEKDQDSLEETKLLKSICEARLIELKKDEAAVVNDGAPTTDEDEGDEVLVIKDNDEQEDDSEDDEPANGKRRRAAPVVPKPVPQDVQFDPTGLSQEALQARLEKMARPAHVVSTITTTLGEDGLFPLDLVADPLAAPPVHTVFAHQLDHKGRGPFEQITDKTMTGTLWTCSMHPTSQGTCDWRALRKVRVNIPCSFSGCGQELLVVDHERAYILRMPKGTATGESYRLRDDSTTTEGPQFKVSHCQLSEDYVCITGFRQGVTSPLVLVYNRHKPLCTVIQTSIPVTSSILSLQHAGHVLLGMKDGTILRVLIPGTPSRKDRPCFTLYHPVADKPDEAAIKALRKARGAFKIGDSPKDQDCILHAGTPHPVKYLVERRNRLIAATSMGLHLFRLHFPLEAEGRRFTMVIKNVVSYAWRGNVMVMLNQDNSFRMMQLHTNRLEVTVGPPISLMPKPPEITLECAAISMSDQVGCLACS